LLRKQLFAWFVGVIWQSVYFKILLQKLQHFLFINYLYLENAINSRRSFKANGMSGMCLNIFKFCVICANFGYKANQEHPPPPKNMLLHNEKILHWPFTTHCWGAQGCRGDGSSGGT
jgi:hypothetical protein